MADIATVRLMTNYNASANNNMNQIIAGLNEEQWEREFFGYFKSIRSLCNHLYISDFTWLRRFSGLRELRYAKDTILTQDIKFGLLVLSSTTDYVRKREGLDRLLMTFANEITAKDMEGILSYKDSGGNDHRKNFGALVIHALNHQTHHRGMISLYLEGLGIENDFNSLSEMIPEE